MKKTLSIATKILFVSVCSMLSSVPAQAFTVFCTNCATNIQAAQGYAEQVAAVANQVTSLEHQVESIGYQLQNLQKIDVSDWGDAMNQINQLGVIARQGDSLAYSLADINDEWQRRFKGYEGWKESGSSPEQVSDQYRLWGKTMRDTAESSLKVANQMAQVQQQDEQTLTTLQNHSSSAVGALQVAQAGNELVAQTARQMQKMQTLLQTDIQMTATTMATETEKQEQQQAATDATIADPKVDPENGLDWSKPWNNDSNLN